MEHERPTIRALIPFEKGISLYRNSVSLPPMNFVPIKPGSEGEMAWLALYSHLDDDCAE